VGASPAASCRPYVDIRLHFTKLLSSVRTACTDSHDHPPSSQSCAPKALRLATLSPGPSPLFHERGKAQGEPEQGCGTSAGTALVAGHHHVVPEGVVAEAAIPGTL
jgi:hypothetical protein